MRKKHFPGSRAGSALPLLTVVLFLLGTTGAPAATRVAASIFPVADLVSRVGGELIEVHLLLEPGMNPHTFEPGPAAVERFSQSRLFFQVGAGLESWAGKLVTAAAAPATEVVTLTEGLPLLKSTGPEEADRRIFAAALGVERSGPAGGLNPHVWLDPRLARSMVDRIERELARIMPDSAPAIGRRAERLRADLDELDRDIREAVSGFGSLKFVTSHSAWVYFARRYGLDVIGVLEGGHHGEPSPRRIAELIKLVRAEGVRAVFAEPQLPPGAAGIVAREAKIPLLLLDPIGGSAPGRDSYERLMRYNLSVLARGLGSGHPKR